MRNGGWGRSPCWVSTIEREHTDVMNYLLSHRLQDSESSRNHRKPQVCNVNPAEEFEKYPMPRRYWNVILRVWVT